MALLPPADAPADDLSAKSSDSLLDFLDARVLIAEDIAPGVGRLPPDTAGLPPEPPPVARTSRHPAHHDVRFLLRTSGTTAHPRWTALDDDNIFNMLESHLPLLPYREARVLSVLPWHHAFGLILELLPALLHATDIIRDPDQGRVPEKLLELGNDHDVSCLSGVPILFQRLFDLPAGESFLRNLTGGIVGGAPVDPGLAARLSHTRLRPGYGQTEASPGITLGEPGRWRAGSLGRAVGCETRINSAGELEFRGPNLARGTWNEEGLTPFAREDFRPTGDLVAEENGEYVFRGRRAGSFKLSNGRFVIPEEREARLLAARSELRCVLLYGDSTGRAHLLVACDENANASDRNLDLETAGTILELPLAGIRFINADTFRFTRKGDLDRRATLLANKESLP